MLPLMSTTKRVGVVEIGSRGVRLLIGDVTNATFVPVARRYDSSVQLMNALTLPQKNLEITIKNIYHIVEQYCALCQTMAVKELVIVGTEALRQLKRTMPVEFKAFRRMIPDLRILMSKEEAFYALVTAIRSQPNVAHGNTVITIDMGAGSIEVVAGKQIGEQIHLTAHRSLPLGTDILISQFQEIGGNCADLNSWIGQKIGQLLFRGAKKASHCIALGSVPTKLAWLNVRRDMSERYDPRKVHGKLLAKSAIQQFIRISTQSGVSMREIVTPDNPTSREFETVLAGSVALIVLMEWLGIDEVVVCAEALRYGIAWELASRDHKRLTK